MLSNRLRSLLSQHKIFQDDETTAELPTEPSHDDRVKQLVYIDGSNLFVWKEARSCILTTNLRSSLDGKDGIIQVFYCQNAPLFEVNKISFNHTNTHVALVGSRGATVLTLPRRWGKEALYEGGKPSITCRSFAVAERFFMSNISVQLLQASWYPSTSSQHPHLCILTSDNILRIYNATTDPQTPVQTHKLNQTTDLNNTPMSASRMSLQSMFSITSRLGETIVSFDFASVMLHTPPHRTHLRKKPEPVSLQPIYLLQGNGDVLLLLTSLTDNKFSHGMLQGPLIMLPPAEDNYGVDSCSILVMESSPTTIVIATTAGKLHHCVALWGTDTNDELSPDSDAESISSYRSTRSNTDLNPPTLYVYESVELELDLLDEDVPENHHIILHKDTILMTRYHCSTSVGVHSIALPWLKKMDGFIRADEDDMNNLAGLSHDDPCIVEHVLCTKPTPSTSPCPIVGITIATDPVFGPTLLCLMADNHCTTVPLLNTFVPSPPPLMSEGGDTTVTPTPVKRSELSFIDHIKAMLKRDVSQPIIRSGSHHQPMSERECLQVVTRATQVLRDEYMLKQKLARNAINKRVKLLVDLKEHQIDELQQLEEQKEMLTDNAEMLANKYEDCKERQEELVGRLEDVVRRIKDRDPVLSKAEHEMSKELKLMKDKLWQVDNRIKQLKIKQEYQEDKLSSSGKRRSGSSTSVQKEKLKQILLEDGEKIHELIKKLNNMNSLAGL
nr:nuclear pore complex protein Nup88 [Ciona intestinalis]|eukprot:XP_002131376.1 nuclear pore complex protein Nup88 [Ciona intestinalis]